MVRSSMELYKMEIKSKNNVKHDFQSLFEIKQRNNKYIHYPPCAQALVHLIGIKSAALCKLEP